jgi:signal transduction histidine kinase
MEARQNFISEEAQRPYGNSDREQTERLEWLVRIRWWAPAVIAVVVGLSMLAGFDAKFGVLFLAAGYILGYNLLFYRLNLRYGTAPGDAWQNLDGRVCWQAALDGSAVFLLAYFSAGIASPVSFFLVVPVILVSTRLSRRPAFAFSAVLLAAIMLMAVGERTGWLPRPAFVAQTGALNPGWFLFQLVTLCLLIGAVTFLTSAMSQRAGNKTRELKNLYEAADRLIQKFWQLFEMLQSIGSAHDLNQVLNVVSSRTAAVMNVKGISIKLLSEDGKQLRYAAAYGLPDDFVREKVVEVQKSPLNKRIIEGEPYVTGNVTVKEMFQFGEILAEAHIKSVLFLPLRLEGKVIGILGAYCYLPDRFSDEDIDFFRLVAGLVAIALENARAYEAVAKLVNERSWYMLRVAHNLRAPLAGMLSILDVVRGGYLGALNAEQQEYLRRLDRRSRTMLMLINELMTLAKSREEKRTDALKSTRPAEVARRIRRTFQDRAAGKNITFDVTGAENLPSMRGDLEMIEQILENLVSNAIKYTLSDGTVAVKFSQTANRVRIEISDTGIGIPKNDRPRLFSEFFRAENARAVEKTGTGLGLAIVKEFVDKLGGRVLVESEEKMGTIFVVDLPIATINNGGRHDNSGNI